LPGNLEYVGSKYCKLCHDYEYEKWMASKQVFIPGLSKQASPDSRHAGAFATLEKVNSEYDPECVVCHVVGMQYQTGYISPTKTPELKDVGCENCHGPGSEHLRSLGAIETSGPISTCSDCHTAEHSGEYLANQKQYFEKIIHWREPVSIVRVTEPNRSSK
jgi:nitrate/TMAO reductase-like tetraheme cytochrome c subunit